MSYTVELKDQGDTHVIEMTLDGVTHTLKLADAYVSAHRILQAWETARKTEETRRHNGWECTHTGDYYCFAKGRYFLSVGRYSGRVSLYKDRWGLSDTIIPDTPDDETLFLKAIEWAEGYLEEA